MRYLKCECGACERWDTGEMVHPCQGCAKCQTTYATRRDDHRPLQPHNWKPQFDRNTGLPSRRMCADCYARERD